MSLLDAIATPLEYAGSIAEKFGGRAVRGLLGGKPRELLSPIPFSDSLGITDPGDRVTGSELARQFGLVRGDDPFGQGAMGLGIDIATDPLSYLGLGAAHHLARAPEAASQFSKLKALREPSMLVKNLGQDAERVVGRRLDRAAIPGVDDSLASAAKQMHQMRPAAGLMVSPWAEGPFKNMGYSLGSQTDAHELAHAMVKNAAVGGGEDALPFFGRQAARAYRSGGFKPTGFDMGVGNILDELNSHGIDARKQGGYLRGALGFALNPRAHELYHKQFASVSPGAAALFHAAPGAIPGAVAGGAAGAYGGYEHDGAGGAVAGGLGGALLGGLAGGAASHLALAPNNIRGLDHLLGGENAAMLPPLKGWSKEWDDAVRSGYDEVSRAVDAGRATPAGRMAELAQSAGVNFFIPRTLNEMLGSLGKDADKWLIKARAWYDPVDREVVPNALSYNKQWSKNPVMRGLTNEDYKTHWKSTQFPDHIAIHEIQHALHHQPHAQASNFFHGFSPENPNLFNLSVPMQGGQSAPFPHAWDLAKPEILAKVSDYAGTAPHEFVAERGAQNFFDAFKGQGRDRNEILDPLYRTLQGPGVHKKLLDRFNDIYQGDLAKALQGESASLGLKYDREARIRSMQDMLTEYGFPAKPLSLFGRPVTPQTIQGMLDAHGEPATKALVQGLTGLSEYDGPTPGMFNLTRNDPEWVNNRTFYHGTATPGLSPETLDPLKTSTSSLHGQGIYATDEASTRDTNQITQGYAKAAVGKSKRAAVDEAAGQAVERMQRMIDIASRRHPESLARLIQPDLNMPIKDLMAQTGESLGDIAPGSRLWFEVGDQLRKKAESRMATPSPLIYQAQSDFGKILDLDKPLSGEIMPWLRQHYDPGGPDAELIRSMVGRPEYDQQTLEAMLGDHESFARDLSHSGTHPGDVFNRHESSVGSLLKGMRSMYDEAGFANHSPLIDSLRRSGYDAMTHTGGLNTSSPEHQVVIGLDPRKYRTFELFKALTGQ